MQETMPSHAPIITGRNHLQSLALTSGTGAGTARTVFHTSLRKPLVHSANKWIPRSVRTAGSVFSGSDTVTTRDPVSLVQEILQLVHGTDSGAEASDETRESVDARIEELSDIGLQQVPRPLQNPLLYGNYNVAWQSTRRAPGQSGQPAGGRFRGRIGKALFKPRGLFQSVFTDGTVTNKLDFMLFGIVPGAVGLRGALQPEGDDDATVRVKFEPPRLSLPGGLQQTIGPPSEVVLMTTYVDEHVRLGRGGRGSLFVFTRGGASDRAGDPSLQEAQMCSFLARL